MAISGSWSKSSCSPIQKCKGLEKGPNALKIRVTLSVNFTSYSVLHFKIHANQTYFKFHPVVTLPRLFRSLPTCGISCRSIFWIVCENHKIQFRSIFAFFAKS